MMGHKLKVLAIVLAIIGIVACVICFFVGSSMYAKDKDYLEYATAYGGAGYRYPSLEAAGNRAYTGKMLKTYSLYGIIGSVIAMLPLYWFGCLFERVEKIQKTVNENRRKLDEILKRLPKPGTP